MANNAANNNRRKSTIVNKRKYLVDTIKKISINLKFFKYMREAI